MASNRPPPKRFRETRLSPAELDELAIQEVDAIDQALSDLDQTRAQAGQPQLRRGQTASEQARGSMSEVSDASEPPPGSMAAAISNAVVGLLCDYAGRGPERARTTIDDDLIVVTVRDCLTKAERTLAGHGRSVEVLALRRALQDVLRGELVAVVEQLTGRTVEASLSDNLHDPDVAVQVFVMDPSDRSRPAKRSSRGIVAGEDPEGPGSSRAD